MYVTYIETSEINIYKVNITDNRQIELTRSNGCAFSMA
jgi:hypothetical protein